MPTRITLVRHGQTVWNAIGRWQGHAVVPLNNEGREQAERIAGYLASNQPPCDYLYSSDLPRARETASIIAERLGQAVLLDERFREMDAGEWQGLTVDEIKAWDTERFEEMLADPYNNARPGGESYQDQEQRAFDAVQDLASRHPDQHVMIVTHEETIASILRATTGMDIPLSCLVPGSFIPNTSLTEIVHQEPTAWDVVTVGATPHFEMVNGHRHNGH